MRVNYAHQGSSCSVHAAGAQLMNHCSLPPDTLITSGLPSGKLSISPPVVGDTSSDLLAGEHDDACCERQPTPTSSLPIPPTSTCDAGHVFRSAAESCGVTTNAPQRARVGTKMSVTPAESAAIWQLQSHFDGLQTSARRGQPPAGRLGDQLVLARPVSTASWTQTIEGWAKAVEHRARSCGMAASVLDGLTMIKDVDSFTVLIVEATSFLQNVKGIHVVAQWSEPEAQGV